MQVKPDRYSAAIRTMSCNSPSNQPKDVEDATIYFLRPDDIHRIEKPFAFRYDPGDGVQQSNFALDPYTGISIKDIRHKIDDFTFDKHGFTVLKLPDSIPYESFETNDGLQCYFSQLEIVLKHTLGASHVEVFRHGVSSQPLIIITLTAAAWKLIEPDYQPNRFEKGTRRSLYQQAKPMNLTSQLQWRMSVSWHSRFPFCFPSRRLTTELTRLRKRRLKRFGASMEARQRPSWASAVSSGSSKSTLPIETSSVSRGYVLDRPRQQRRRSIRRPLYPYSPPNPYPLPHILLATSSFPALSSLPNLPLHTPLPQQS